MFATTTSLSSFDSSTRVMFVCGGGCVNALSWIILSSEGGGGG